MADKKRLKRPKSGKLDADDLYAIINTSKDLHWILDEDGLVRFVNSTSAMGFESDEVINMSFFAYLHPDDVDSAHNYIAELRVGHKPFLDCNWRMRSKNEGWVAMEVWGAALPKTSNMMGSVLHMTDVSLRSNIAENSNLTKQARNLLEIANFLPDVFWITELKTNTVQYISPGYERVWGKSCASVYEDADSFLYSIHRDDISRVIQARNNRLQHESYEVEFRIIRPDGEVRHIWAHGHTQVNCATNETDRFIGIATDITERKQNELNLRLFRKQIDGANDIMILLNAATLEVININDRGLSTLGYTVEEILNTPLNRITASNRDALLLKLNNRDMGAPSIRYEDELICRDGSTFPVEINVNIVSTDLEYLYASIRDISDKKRLADSMRSTVYALASALESRDSYTSGHQQRVCLLAVAIAELLGLSPEVIQGLELAATVHDIGKIAVPSQILSKPGRLLPPEFELIKLHAQTGYEILSKVDFPWPIAKIVQQHHERCDGSGYPLGLCKDEILIEARIIAVADVIEAMTSHRPYRPALGINAALDEIKRGRGKIYDETVVDTALSLHSLNKLIPLITC
ncbi:HD domain-containing phosphohydrolase [Zhongshania aquimaris]|uniref:PAS domain S-box protein n=1 Tax=Zhongshania aquimaris TaxID=2857107 RepID=A0ABS6VRJ8_9GAMM|nr:HD domain-containing phosphohydrolase [Zhongshania aquimaris]MBW2940664.1 PAS domain S-box protein [Zhongshania aquimaris]